MDRETSEIRRSGYLAFGLLSLVVANIIVLTLLSAGGCATRANTTPGVPSTALQWTIVYNGAVAKTNRAVEQTVETLAHSGTIQVAQARTIITICGKIASASEAVRAVTSKSTEATWNTDATAIRGILDQLGPGALANIGMSNNQTLDAAVGALSAAITLLRNQVLAGGTR